MLTSADAPFDLSADVSYIMAVKYYIALGKDGYSGFKDPRVEWLTDPESALMIRDVIFNAFERTGPDYKPDKKREAIR